MYGKKFRGFILSKLSLMIGFVAYILLYLFRFPNYKFATYLFQWTLFFNVAEAGILAIENSDYVLGILILGCSPFAPRLYVNPHNKMGATKGNILNILNHTTSSFLSVKWYFRCYYIGIGTLHLFTAFFYDKNVYPFCTCYVPLFLSEYHQKEKYYVQFFSIRTFALFLMVFSSAGVMGGFNTFQQIIPTHELAELPTISKNILHTIFIILSFVLCELINPSNTGNNDSPPVHKEKKDTAHDLPPMRFTLPKQRVGSDPRSLETRIYIAPENMNKDQKQVSPNRSENNPVNNDPENLDTNQKQLSSNRSENYPVNNDPENIDNNQTRIPPTIPELYYPADHQNQNMNKMIFYKDQKQLSPNRSKNYPNNDPENIDNKQTRILPTIPELYYPADHENQN